MKENGILNTMKEMVAVFRYGQMDRDMMDSGKMVLQVDTGDLCMLKATSMKELGRMTKQTDTVIIVIIMEVVTKVNG